MSVDFFDRPEGHRFACATVPNFARAVDRLAKAMERANRLKAKELEMAGAKMEPEEPESKAEAEG